MSVSRETSCRGGCDAIAMNNTGLCPQGYWWKHAARQNGKRHLLGVDPGALPFAPHEGLADAIEHRRLHTVQSCVRCPDRAAVAYVMGTPGRNRWIDLCLPCDLWLRNKAEV